jgi:exosortase
LQVLASLSGSLILYGFAFAISVMGITGFLFGRECLRIVAAPFGFLILMIPMPSYLLGELTWHLQTVASTASSSILRGMSIPVYQNGNLLKLANFTLEVKEACSGSRFVFALLALALLLGLTVEQKWGVRLSLVIAAPILAVFANVGRIVGTGLIASRFGPLAADESLHAVWGIGVFILAVTELLIFQRILRWLSRTLA